MKKRSSNLKRVYKKFAKEFKSEEAAIDAFLDSLDAVLIKYGFEFK